VCNDTPHSEKGEEITAKDGSHRGGSLRLERGDHLSSKRQVAGSIPAGRANQQ
jgi:hypothetical protein